MKTTEIAASISKYIDRFGSDPKIARKTWTDGNGVDRELSLYWHGHAWRGGSRVMVRYVSYQSASSLTKEEAEQYLAWLDAGNVGRHYEALKSLNADKSN
jgi:hypothetical protein